MGAVAFNVGAINPGGMFGGYLNVTEYPQDETAIFDMFGPGQGFVRFTITTEGNIKIAYSVMAAISEGYMSETPIQPGKTLWLSACCSNRNQGSNNGYLDALAKYSDGSVLGTIGIGTGNGSQVWNGSFSIGEALSDPGIAVWPTPGFGWMSKMIVNGAYGYQVRQPPNADYTSDDKPTALYGGFYNCRGPEGNISGLTDDSGNGTDLSGDLQRFAIGPYAS